MNTTYNIAPYPIQTAEIAEIESISVDPGIGKAVVRINLRSKDGQVLKTAFAEIIGEDYGQWKDNDEYIVEKSFSQLGISAAGAVATIIEVPAPKEPDTKDEVAKDDEAKKAPDEVTEINEPQDGKVKVKKKD